MDPSEPRLVISDGSVPGLLAIGAAGDRPTTPATQVWCPYRSDSPRGVASTRQAELYGLRLTCTPVAEPDWIPGLLIAGAAAARSEGLSHVLWPENAGAPLEPDLDRIALNVDRALLASRMVSLGAPTPIRIQTPYADLTDRQLADLVLDMDLPIWTCWWYQPVETTGPTARAAQSERDHWTRMLNAAGWHGPLPGPELAPTVWPIQESPSTRR